MISQMPDLTVTGGAVSGPEAFDLAGAYAISIVLATIAILVLVAMTIIRPKEETA